MATELAYPDGGQKTGIVAAGVISAYTFVGLDRQTAGANEPIAGIALAPSLEIGDQITIQTDAIAPVLAGSNASTNNLSPGTAVKTDAAGKAIAATADTDYIVGRVWVDSPTADAADDLVLVQITNEGRLASS